MEITKKIIDYMLEQNLDFIYVSKSTSIPVKKFRDMGKTPFNASELCVICEFLKMNPEQFYIKKIKDR